MSEQDELERLHKMRQDFVANVSHELRTPLTVIHGYLEMLLSSYKEVDSKLYEIWKKVFEQTERMEHLVADLLLLSKLESEEPLAKKAACELPKLIDKIMQDAKELSQGRHHFKVNIDRSLDILGESSELRSAFSNLVMNAVHYTPLKGEISISWYADKDGVHFEAKDNGIGVPAQDIPRLTERFYRVDKGRSRQSGGTGLGLAIVKHVLMRHEAKLTIQSELGKGSVFTATFPANRKLVTN
ncbi:MAG: histidine kinase [Gammaproteobacteria bacterium]|jgi:two-component system phosphate regulon sensor histidine kinase PhoR|nr:histidine kinase [Gammaproteobacteria bacterium]